MGAGEASNRQIKVKVNHLTKKFGDLLVLDDISFDVEKGDLLCVVGPTGCGKTTFLNSLTKIYDVTSGMLQRVSIARAFATEPELLLMDEPYGQLDIELRFKLEDELVRLWQMTGTTVIFITHNIEEAVYLGENIMILTNKPTTVKERLANRLPRPRDIAAPEFVRLREQVTDLIRWW